MNHIVIAGHLAKDAESRFTAGGTKVTNLVLATNSRKGGKDETTWWNVSIWGDRYDKMVPYLTKGKAVIISGEMSKPEIYTDKNGNPQLSSINVTAENVRFSPFGKPSENEGGQQSSSQGQQAEMSTGQANAAASAPAEDENLPF